MQTSKAGRPRKVWAFDSEFLQEGKIKTPKDTHCIQFSDGEKAYLFWWYEVDKIRQFFYNRRKSIDTMYCHVSLPDLASLGCIFGDDYTDKTSKKHVTITKYRGKAYGLISILGVKCKVYDAQPMFNNFNMPRLEDVGRWVGYEKLDKPDWLGQKSPFDVGKAERDYFEEYAKTDAIITSLGVRKLIEIYDADPAVYASAGSLAGHYFNLPKRLEMQKKTVIISTLENIIKRENFAGRSECFVSGYTPNAFYLDVKSLYPCSVVATKALQITGAKQCAIDEVIIGDEHNFGWLEGVFETNNDKWGLPIRAKNNTYANGIIQGLYHSFDLAAAKAKPLYITRAYKPTYSDDNNMHVKYASMLDKRLCGVLSKDESLFYKSILNALTGKLGQARPTIARTSNFYAYSSLLAHSHFTMSRLFDMCNTPIIGTDTDSIFTTSDISGTKFYVADEQVPIILDDKSNGGGDLVYFRSKQYILLNEKQQDQIRRKDRIEKPVYGHHAWQYFKEDFFKLYFGDVTNLETRKNLKHSLDTKVKKTLQLELGRWLTEPVTLDQTKIKDLVKADRKRKRAIDDSYQLVIDRKSSPSKAWSIDEIMLMPDNVFLDYPRVVE